MLAKTTVRARAVALRRAGKTYSEISTEVSVAKSTLSLWLRSIVLSKEQKQVIATKQMVGQIQGAAKRRQQRLQLSEEIRQQAMREMVPMSKGIFRLLGAMLYWAEGTKQKLHNVSQKVTFANSDPVMAKFFYQWLVKICCIVPNDIYFELYIHRDAFVRKASRFWETTLGLPKNSLTLIRYKKGNQDSCRRNKGKNYRGLIRINVRRSTNLNRKIMGWVEGCVAVCNSEIV